MTTEDTALFAPGRVTVTCRHASPPGGRGRDALSSAALLLPVVLGSHNGAVHMVVRGLTGRVVGAAKAPGRAQMRNRLLVSP